MHSLSRRKFFEESLIASAALATASSALAADPAEQASAAPRSANETLQHAVIGCRIRGRVHGREFAGRNGVEVGYVCDPDLELANELAEQVAEQQGRRPRVVQDLRVIYDDPAVDTVSIAAPNHWHALAAIWAMQAGKDVYVEKPVSHNIVEGRRTVQVARKTGRICQSGTQNRSSGALKTAAEYIRAGKLGEVRLARSIIYGRRGAIGAPGTCEIPPQVDFNLWLGPGMNEKPTRPRLHYDWHWVWDTGNGELGNNNIHMVDICRWLMGLDGLGQTAISVGGRLGYEDAGETPNTQVVVHQFDGATIIQEVRGLKSEPFSDKFKSGYVIYGSEGLIADGTLFDLDGKLVEKFSGRGDNHFANFIAAVRSRRSEELNADIDEGHISSALCHLGNISYRLGETASAAEIQARLSAHEYDTEVAQTVSRMVDHLRDNEVDLAATPLTIGPLLKIDSDGERLIDNPAANALLGREYRRPFVVPGENEI